MSTAKELVDNINQTVVELIVNQTTTGDDNNGTISSRPNKGTPEGMAMAYGSLVIMALIPIFYGSFKSVGYHREQRVSRILFQKKNCLNFF